MKLNEYTVRMNPNTYNAELLLSVSVPLELIEGTDTMVREEAGRILGSYLLEIFEQIKHNES
jgi:hypothetical protein